MGLGPSWGKSSSIYDKSKIVEVRIVGNPDPFDFRIDRHEQIGDYLILLVVYRGVKNYEGKKVMVYKDLTFKQVQTFKSLDPHFSESKDFASPIARFKPDITGWAMAKRFVNCLIL
jgi:hypothetical protein